MSMSSLMTSGASTDRVYVNANQAYEISRAIIEHIITYGYVKTSRSRQETEVFVYPLKEHYSAHFTTDGYGGITIHKIVKGRSVNADGNILRSNLNVNARLLKETSLGFGVWCLSYKVTGDVNFEFDYNMR